MEEPSGKLAADRALEEKARFLGFLRKTARTIIWSAFVLLLLLSLGTLVLGEGRSPTAVLKPLLLSILPAALLFVLPRGDREIGDKPRVESND